MLYYYDNYDVTTTIVQDIQGITGFSVQSSRMITRHIVPVEWKPKPILRFGNAGDKWCVMYSKVEGQSN